MIIFFQRHDSQLLKARILKFRVSKKTLPKYYVTITNRVVENILIPHQRILAFRHQFMSVDTYNVLFTALLVLRKLGVL